MTEKANEPTPLTAEQIEAANAELRRRAKEMVQAFRLRIRSLNRS